MIPTELIIDDENSSNGNEAIIWTHTTNFNNTAGITSAPRRLNNGERFRGIVAQADGDTAYEFVSY